MSQDKHHRANDYGGLTVHDLLMLPEEETRLLLLWMQRQPTCNLKAVSDFLNQTEVQTQRLLSDLQQRGFVQSTLSSQETLYQVHLIAMRHQRCDRETSNMLETLIDDE